MLSVTLFFPDLLIFQNNYFKECMEVLDVHFAQKRAQINDSRQTKEFKEENGMNLMNFLNNNSPRRK